MIYMSGSGNSGKAYSALMVDTCPDLNLQHSGGQGFPLYLYEPTTNEDDELFASSSTSTETQYTRKDAISDEGLAHFQAAYPAKGEGDSISKEDLFYYIYGLLHSAEYRTRYADNLSKELPRIPAVKKFADFMAFSKAGRDLAHWHSGIRAIRQSEHSRKDMAGD